MDKRVASACSPRPGADLDAKNHSGWTAAMVAAQHGHEACLAVLTPAGANLGSKDKAGWTPSMHAAANGRQACLGLLVGAGADIEEVKSHWGSTEAMEAAAHGRPAIAAFIEGVEPQGTAGLTRRLRDPGGASLIGGSP